MTITDALNDLRERASQERDGITYAAIGQIILHLPPAAASQPVPDVSGTAPFRPSDPEALEPDARGLNRTR